jgi:hemolysin activation/secretion protein
MDNKGKLLCTGSNQWDAKPIDGRQQQQQQQQQEQEQDEEVENRDADMHFEIGDADASARNLEVNPIQRIRVEGERRGGGGINFTNICLFINKELNLSLSNQI